MPIDNMTFFDIYAKFFEDIIYNIFSLYQAVIMVFSLNLHFFIGNEIPLKCRHLFLAIDWGVLIRPDIPHDILSIFMFFSVILFVISLSCVVLKHIIKFFARILFAANLNFTEVSLLIKRHTAMIEKIGIITKIQTAFIK